MMKNETVAAISEQPLLITRQTIDKAWSLFGSNKKRRKLHLILSGFNDLEWVHLYALISTKGKFSQPVFGVPLFNCRQTCIPIHTGRMTQLVQKQCID